jgi:5-methylthioadenosine/S-adenosylhomocysteine deaminase
LLGNLLYRHYCVCICFATIELIQFFAGGNLHTILIRNATVITMSDEGIIHCDIFIEGNRIKRIGDCGGIQADAIIDATDKVITPGFVQTHIHLCQVLFRGTADDMELLDWLRERTWKLEAAHDFNTTYASAWLGCMELIRSGTTCIADMGSIKNTEADAQAIYDFGIRAKFGKAMTDFGDLPPELGDLPGAFQETTQESIDQSMCLIKDWHGKDDGRMQYLFAPRGILSTSEELLLELKKLAAQHNTGIHTHACENKTESRRVVEQRGASEIKYLHSLGLTGENLLLAHCIWVDEQDLDILQETNTRVLHCPSTNLKLASGIAPIAEMLKRGITVSIGADGAPANNNLNAFVEMRHASLLQKGITLDPTVLPANQAFEMATLNGARTLGLENEIGSIEVGKKADLVILDLDQAHTVPHSSLYSTLVYAANSENVDTVIIDGIVLFHQKKFVRFDEKEMLHKCKAESEKLIQRAHIIL